MAKQSINELVTKIIALHDEFDPTIAQYREVINKIENENSNLKIEEYPPDYWRNVAYIDALIKVRIFLENNFNYVESLGLLALTRYLHELSVWIRLLRQDVHYGYIYHRMLLEENFQYYSEQVLQIQREIDWMKYLHDKESKAHQDIMTQKEISSHFDVLSHSEKLKNISSDIDLEAAGRFSIYADDAILNGYGFQAYLVEKKVLPNAKKNQQEVERALNDFKDAASDKLKQLGIEKWKWNVMSKKVGLLNEFEYIYSYTSRLLHAKPSSLTTNQKSLEESEMKIFLKYSFVRIVEILAITQNHINYKKLN